MNGPILFKMATVTSLLLLAFSTHQTFASNVTQLKNKDLNAPLGCMMCHQGGTSQGNDDSIQNNQSLHH